MAATIYALCALTSFACFALLWRSWRASRARLLFWSALCFAALSVNNLLLVADKLLLPQVELITWRLVFALVAVLLMLYGLVWGED
ncbi:MAG: hypothetical protein HY854_11420 [Burkholderiales bacterium]|nr:hypothetical protein [Burkholderiales bacterium]